MPLTFPAHQGLIVPIKLRWPRAIDATALCIGAAAPDFAYPLDRWIDHRSHTLVGLVLWALPFTLVAAAVTRRWAAAGIFAVAPDLGPLRLRSYRVLATRRPSAMVTVVSAVLGSGSHIVIDAFTHQTRWGANLAGLNDVLFELPVRGPMTGARLLQYLGHGLGSLIFVAVLVAIASRGLLERWYGPDAVRRARAVTVTAADRWLFAALALIPALASIPIAVVALGWFRFEPLTTLAIATLVAGSVVGRRRPVAVEDSGHPGSAPPQDRAESQVPQAS